jgi:hypothetical protein
VPFFLALAASLSTRATILARIVNMKRTRLLSVATAIWFAALLSGSAAAAELAGKWTSDGRYVFSFQRLGEEWMGVVTEAATGRQFNLDDIVVNGDRVSFFVVHDAVWDEEVQANGGRAFRNTANGTLTESTLTISGAREHTGERTYRAELKRVQ